MMCWSCAGGRRLRRGRSSGFTLVELLVALAAMAVLSVMAWRGIDAMGRAQTSTRVFGSDVQALQVGLGQWSSDLDAVAVMPALTALDFDGRVLRITRRWPYAEPGASAASAGGGLKVVAWGLRDVDGRRLWSRWQSGVLRTRAQWTEAWQQAAWWGQNPTEELRQGEVQIAVADELQVFYYRNNSWTSPLSSAANGAAGAAAQAPLPDGVRLMLSLTPGQAVSGRLTRDWIRPTLGPGGS
ncbi:MAG: prepilin-type N-terminal cleavage/methylation domain-containing protein [Burkholderiaceae bacterium]